MLYALLNIEKANWSTSSSVIMYSNVLSIIVLTSSVTFALALIIYLVKVGPTKWGQEEFKKKNGAVFDGSIVMEFVNTGRSQAHLIIIPIVYYLRRLIFIVILLRVHTFTG